MACSSPVAWSSLVCAANPPGRVPPKLHGPMVSSSSDISYGSGPASTVARVRPPWAMMQVLAAKSMFSCTGPAGHSSWCAAATALERTHRLRYHSALPPRSRTPCTMPEPRNQ